MQVLERPTRKSKDKLPSGFNLSRLCESIVRDRKDLEPFRQNRRDVAVQLAGAHYSDNAAPVEVPVNLLAMHQEIITGSLCPNNLRAMLSTFEDSQTAAVEGMQAWLNEEVVRLNVVDTYKRAITDAWCWLGIVEVALADPIDAALSGWDDEAGQPMMDCIDPDDWFGDMSVRRLDRMAYAGHTFRVPVKLANEMYMKGQTEKLEASDERDYNYGGDERIDTIVRTQGHREEHEDHCDLWQIYLAQHKLIVTVRDDGGIPDGTREPVRVQRWIGPYCGPYHYLSLGTLLPGNLMPVAPAMKLIDLHRAYNNAYRKLLWQTRNYKKVLPYAGGNADDVKRLRDEPNGGTFQCDRPELLKEVEVNVPSNALLVSSDHIKSMFDFVGGNLALLGGRGAQSRTATQDKMLNENASSGVASMQDQSFAFVQHTMEAMNWYSWYHPTKVMKSKIAPPSLPNLSFTRAVHPHQRRGDMPAIKVDPYSLPRQTPQGRLAFIEQVLQVTAPMASLMQSQGVMPNMDELLKIFAKYGDEPDLSKIYQVSQPPPPQQGGDGGGPPGMPANTTRTYNRTSTAGGPQEQAADLTKNIAKMNGPVNPNQG